MGVFVLLGKLSIFRTSKRMPRIESCFLGRSIFVDQTKDLSECINYIGKIVVGFRRLMKKFNMEL